MKISDILQEKGTEVTTISSNATMREVIGILASRRIGALPVCTSESSIEGIVSERDVIRALSENETDVRDMPVHALMSTPVFTCSRDATLQEAMGLMIERRIRHVPVVHESELVGILSIGDLVNARLRQAEVDREQMAEYIASPAYN